ncbi:MAG: MFS transporter [Anaerovoracaceae bacterium]
MNDTIKKFDGYKQAAYVAFVTLLVGACFGSLSLLLPCVVERLGVTYSEAGIPSTVETVVCFIAGLFAGKFLIKYQAKRCVLFCCIVAAAFVPVYAYAPSLMIINLYEVLLGIAMAVGYSTGMNAFLSKWFISKREVIVGYAQAFIGFGAAIGALVFGQLNESYGLFVTTIVFSSTAIVALVVYLFLIRGPEEVNQKPLGWEEAEKIASEEGASGTTEYGVGFAGAIKSVSFYLMLISCLLWGLSMILFPYFASVLQEGGMGALSSSRFQSFGQVCLAIFCIFIGNMTSKFGTKSYVLLSFGSCIVGVAALGIWCNTGATILVYVAAFFMGSGYCVGTTYGPMLTTKLFGTKEYEKIIPIVFGMRCIGLGFGILIVPVVAEKTGSWANGCWAALAMLVAGIILGYIAVILSPLKKELKSN